jgi:hypothetical protein
MSVGCTDWDMTNVVIFRPRLSHFDLAHSFLTDSPVSQRCKHFEIGGDKKGKGTSLF